jgi:prevent-host-death family protein
MKKEPTSGISYSKGKTEKSKKVIAGVTTRDYGKAMKESTELRMRDGEGETGSAVVQEIMALPGVGDVISVRAAKAHLSGLLDLVVRGREVVITSDGKPKARIVPMDKRPERVPFTGTREHLKTMPPWRGGPTADELVREDRDGRGW